MTSDKNVLAFIKFVEYVFKNDSDVFIKHKKVEVDYSSPIYNIIIHSDNPYFNILKLALELNEYLDDFVDDALKPTLMDLSKILILYSKIENNNIIIRCSIDN